jgi:hypothetical protein
VPDHYANIDDLNKLVPQVPFSATSKPTADVVAELIEDTANDMDAQLANMGYTVPVTTGRKALGFLRRTCVYGALGIAQDVRDTGVRTSTGATGREGKNIWTQRYEQRMKTLGDGIDPTEMADAARTTQQIEKQGENIVRSSVQSVDDDNWLTPTVTRAQVL